LNATKPNLDFIANNYPSVLLQASGQGVGMIWGESGNSEVGHLTLGAGRVIPQYLARINKAIETGDFFNNPAFLKAIEHVKQNQSKLHLAGILTSGSVHAFFSHIPRLIELTEKNKLPNVKIHLFTDGKDSGWKEGSSLLSKLMPYIKAPSVKLATVMGRDFSMDRNENWNLTEKAYNLLTAGNTDETTDNAVKAIEVHYEQGVHDNKMPRILVDPSGLIEDGDAVIFFNFREDSMRQLTRAFVEDDFKVFPRRKVQNLMVVEMVEYIKHPDILVAYPVPEINNNLPQMLSLYGKKQLHLAETEKYAHITYFFNSLNTEPYEGEDDVFIKSIRKAEEEPEMMANDITAKAIEQLQRNYYDVIFINFANADLLAHSGNLEKAVKGIEILDKCIGKLKDAIFEKNGILIITADHGNAESLTSKSGTPETKHNASPVPFYLVVKEYERPRSEEEIKLALSKTDGLIADIAPTILQILGIPKPAEMTGESLFRVLS